MWNLYLKATNERITIPADLETFRGERVTVEAIAEFPTPGRSGKVYARFFSTEPLRTVYPGVVRCYIAEEPRDRTPDPRPAPKVRQ
jgi:hypothetical protein